MEVEAGSPSPELLAPRTGSLNVKHIIRSARGRDISRCFLFRRVARDDTIPKEGRSRFKISRARRDVTGGLLMILLVDNYDSFTYNLVQRLGEIDPGIDLRVVRNDQVTLEEIEAARPTHLIISPGPCTPVQAGISNDVVKRFAPQVPLLGVCLGHQCIGHALGARVVRAGRIMHGKTSLIHHDGRGVYRGLSNPFEATRYHSLVIEPGTLPADLEVVAWTDQDEIMGVRHKRYPLEGVQFHPESFLTDQGIKLLKNFLDQG
jgi:anthranilate synthase/aminodeoxychorismate synthase-like glutamine amidotransferase